MIDIKISNRTATRLDRARHYLDVSLEADYSEVIVATLDAADVQTDMTNDQEEI